MIQTALKIEKNRDTLAAPFSRRFIAGALLEAGISLGPGRSRFEKRSCSQF
jgi:hypothetical protein